MPLSEVTIERFGGLDLVNDPGELGFQGAVDLRDVDFNLLGRVKSRQGFVKATRAAGVNTYDSLFAFHRAAFPDTILAGAGARVESIISGAVSATTTDTAGPHNFAAYGTSTENRVYIANGADAVKYYTFDAFTTPTYTGTTPTGQYVSVQMPDNRLVVAGGAAGISRVLFSDPGAPHTFGTNNYVDLAPGDGEEITAVVAWQTYLFVFKETKFFVFYGNDTVSGNPVFNYRSVYGVGVRQAGCAVAGQDGVYFLDRGGVYKTTGAAPQLVSRQVEPLFDPVSDAHPDQLVGVSPTLSWSDDRLYLCYATRDSTTNNRVLVYHCIDQWWSLWNMNANAITNVRTNGDDNTSEALIFGYSSGLKHIGMISSALTDDGAAIDAYYQTGYGDLGDSTRKVIRGAELDGSGTLTVTVSADYGSNPGGAETVTIPSVTRGMARRSQRGHNFSYRFESLNGSSWRLNRVVPLARAKNPPGIGW